MEKRKTLNLLKTASNLLRLKEVPEKRKEESLSAIEVLDDKKSLALSKIEKEPKKHKKFHKIKHRNT